MTACALAASTLALAKLPPLDDAAKAKAAEAASRAAWQAKVDAYQHCKVQDRIAAQYRGKSGMVRTAATTAGATANAPAPASAGAAAPAPASAGAAAPAPGSGSASLAPSTAAASAALTAAAPPAAGTPAPAVNPASPAVTPPHPQGAGAGAAPSGGTPVATVAAVTIPPCADPGAFAYNPPSQTPLETSGAHSPAGNAVSPPSVRPESAQIAPAGPATPQSKTP